MRRLSAACWTAKFGCFNQLCASPSVCSFHFIISTSCYGTMSGIMYNINSVFWDMAPCSLLKFNLRFGGTCPIHLQGPKIYQIRNQHEAGSKQSCDFQQTTRCYIPESGYLHNHLCENLKTYKYKLFLSSRAVYSVDNHIWIESTPVTLHRWGSLWYYPQIFIWVLTPNSG
jgi:hypothetical protein